MGILWFLIALFTESSNSEQSRREAGMIAVGAMLAGLLTHLLVGKALWPLTVVTQLGTLYFLVRKVCDTEPLTALKICGWYVIVCILAFLASYFLLRWPEPELR